MMKDVTIENLLDLNETIAKELFEGKTYPWEVLPEIGAFIEKLGKTLPAEEYACADGLCEWTLHYRKRSRGAALRVYPGKRHCR